MVTLRHPRYHFCFQLHLCFPVDAWAVMLLLLAVVLVVEVDAVESAEVG
jgi:hypothetical protein